MKHIIVIDDTGSPGNFTESRFIKENRKSLVGVFIHAQKRKNLELTLNKIISTLNSKFGITEIHLKDLINRINECSDISYEESLSIIMILSKWFSSISLPFIVQTCNDQTFAENGISLKGKLDNFNLDKGSDQALLGLIIRIKNFMNEHFPNEEVEIVMDEGRKKSNQVEKFEVLEGLASENCIKYVSSKEFVLLQIADFFAYSLNRTQMTIIKENKTETDKILFEYLNPVLTNQLSIGTALIEGNLDNFANDDLDYYQYMQRQIDGHLEHWRNNQHK